MGDDKVILSAVLALGLGGGAAALRWGPVASFSADGEQVQRTSTTAKGAASKRARSTQAVSRATEGEACLFSSDCQSTLCSGGLCVDGP